MAEPVKNVAGIIANRQGEAVANVAFAFGLDGQIDSQDEAAEPGGAGSGDEIMSDRLIARGIDLKPRMIRSDLGGLLDRGDGAARKNERRVDLSRRLGHRELGARPEEAGVADRGDAKGNVVLSTEQRLAEMASRDIGEIARREPRRGEAFDALAQR